MIYQPKNFIKIDYFLREDFHLSQISWAILFSFFNLSSKSINSSWNLKAISQLYFVLFVTISFQHLKYTIILENQWSFPNSYQMVLLPNTSYKAQKVLFRLLFKARTIFDIPQAELKTCDLHSCLQLLQSRNNRESCQLLFFLINL